MFHWLTASATSSASNYVHLPTILMPRLSPSFLGISTTCGGPQMLADGMAELMPDLLCCSDDGLLLAAGTASGVSVRGERIGNLKESSSTDAACLW